jgi:hypothetical protein
LVTNPVIVEERSRVLVLVPNPALQGTRRKRRAPKLRGSESTNGVRSRNVAYPADATARSGAGTGSLAGRGLLGIGVITHFLATYELKGKPLKACRSRH